MIVQTAENKSVSEYTVEKTTMAHHELFQHSGPKELGLVLHSQGATVNADDDLNAPTASLTMNVVAEHASATVLQSNDQQQQELQWFRDAAKPFNGMTIRVISEQINTHQYESPSGFFL